MPSPQQPSSFTLATILLLRGLARALPDYQGDVRSVARAAGAGLGAPSVEPMVMAVDSSPDDILGPIEALAGLPPQSRTPRVGQTPFRHLQPPGAPPVTVGPGNLKLATIQRPSDLEAAFPTGDAPVPAGLSQYQQTLAASIRLLTATPPATAADWIGALVHILEARTWCLAADDDDCSLLDATLVAAALAGTVTDDGIPARVVLAGIDLAGIQSFVFGVAHRGGAVARSLRARSFLIQLIPEALAQRLLAQLALPGTQLLSVVAGQALLLLPDTPAVQAGWSELEGATLQWSLDEFHGALNPVFATTTVDWQDLDPRTGSGFSAVQARLRADLRQAKLKRLAPLLQTGSQWSADAMVLPVSFDGAPPCASCDRFPALRDGQCHRCRAEADLGGRLRTARSFAYGAGAGGAAIAPGQSLSVVPPGEADIVIGEPAKRNSARRRWATLRVPGQDDVGLSSDQTATFEDLAGAAKGRPYLGYLKADLDRMGELLAFGLRREPGPSLDTLPRSLGISRALEWFFSGHLQALLEARFPAVYSIFSGGDDLFLVGPWDQIVHCALAIHQDLGRYTANPAITLSAAIAITGSSYPVASAAERCAGLLERAKQPDPAAAGHPGRDRVAFGEDLVSWPALIAAVDDWQRLVQTDEAIPTGFLYDLLRFGRAYQRTVIDPAAWQFHAQLAYTAGRNLDPRKLPQLAAWVAPLLVLPISPHHQARLARLSIVAQLAILAKGGRS